MTTTTAPAELTAILHAAGTDWDDLRYKVEEALVEHYDDTHGLTAPDDMAFTEAAEAWAAKTADEYLLPLNPAKDV